MDKKLFVALSLIAFHSMAMQHMELTIDDQLAIPRETTEEKIVITIQDQEREIPKRFIPLIGTLAGLTDTADLPTSAEFYKEGTPLPVSLATWQLIEGQLERVYAMSQDHLSKDHDQLRNEIITDYNKLTNILLIDLMSAVECLAIPLLKEITLEVAKDKLTSDEILTLSTDMRNEVIKRKVLKIAGPVPLKELEAFRGHEGTITSVCVTKDNKIVSGSWDETVRVWDSNGEELAVCRGHENIVSSVCVTTDDKIVSGSNDKTVRIWNMNGKQLAVCRGHEGPVGSVCVTHDNKIVSGSLDNTVRIWDMNGNELAVCRGHEKGVFSVYVTPDNRIVSGSGDGMVRIWDMAGPVVLKELTVHDDCEESFSLCVTPDNRIVSGPPVDCFEDEVLIWDMSGKQLASYPIHEGWVTSFCVTSDNRIVSGSAYDVRIWDVAGNQLAICEGEEEVGHFDSVCVTSDNRIVSGSHDGMVRIWDGRDIILNNHLSNMNEKQAKLLCKALEWIKSLKQNFAVADKYFWAIERFSNFYYQQNDILRRITKYCWRRIKNILENKELVGEPKKRKELEDGESNPAKKVRLAEEELANENK